MNEKSDTSKLLKVVNVKVKQLVEAKAFAVKAKTVVKAQEAEKKQLVESAQRKEIMHG